jgi:hypothetical protein
MRSTQLRRLALAVAGSVAVLAAALALASPSTAAPAKPSSAATPPSALTCGNGATVWQEGSFVKGEFFRLCFPADTETPLPLTLQKQLPSGGWVTVATGTGVAAYHCTGQVFTNYRIKEKTSATGSFFCS